MPLFAAFPAYGRYRSLRLIRPQLRGEDVFALQTALDAYGHEPGPHDGIFGEQTGRALVGAQVDLKIVPDGVAGSVTQERLARALAEKARLRFGLPKGLPIGQLKHESSCRLGNYSPQRPDGTYDAGVAQRNTKHTAASEGFDVPKSIDALARNTRDYFDLFDGLETWRRWCLAAGSWNAPAFACYLARKEGAGKVPTSRTARPNAAALAAFDAYIDSVCAFLVVD